MRGTPPRFRSDPESLPPKLSEPRVHNPPGVNTTVPLAGAESLQRVHHRSRENGATSPDVVALGLPREGVRGGVANSPRMSRAARFDLPREPFEFAPWSWMQPRLGPMMVRPPA